LKRYLKLTLKIIIVSCLLLIGFITAVSYNVFGKLYSEDELLNYKNETASVVTSEDNIIIGKFYNENRTNAEYNDFPEHLINALIATEDARFFQHTGVDSRSLLRVLFKSIIMRDKSSGGGSTITQQLAKNIAGRNHFGFMTMPVNKTKEIIQARRIESIYSKENIITLYLNTVSFGENGYGIESAALRYFNKAVKDLNIEESAILIGILKANTYYNPHLNPENALKRRQIVLNQMLTYNYLGQAEIDSLQQLPLKLDYNNLNSNNNSGHFIVFVEKETKHILDSINKATKKNYNLKKDGLIIKTTLDYKMQRFANLSFKQHLSVMQNKLRTQYNSNSSQKKSLETLINQQLKRLKISKDSAKTKTKQSVFSWKENYRDSISLIDSLNLENTLLHAGLMAMSPKTGAIKTYVGGINHQRYAYDQIFSQRQLASTFKPILYANAFENGKTPCNYLDNEEIILTEYKDWHPTNADKKFGGKYSLQGALLNSKNVPTVNLYLETDFVKLDTIWNRLKFSSRLKNNPSLALGTTNASIYEVTNAYATFANYGKQVKPYIISSISTADGTILYEHKSEEPKTILTEKTATYINEVLQNAISRGTGTRLRNTYGVKMPLAGKTGTSQDYTDAWFVGYNPDLVMVSRVGCNSPKIHFNNGLGAGSSLALPLVAKTLKQIELDSELNKLYTSKFKALSDEDFYNLECEDYKERTAIENFFDLFKSNEKSFEEEQERTERKEERKQKRADKRKARRENE
jgi:penicillin-binding protein 1A